ncbi:hypothetical protein [Enterococcus faecium]|uniref:hypothetical protein n=1 Tax=Enterococcus faecium TaxID=1352 RepID=UPI000DEB66A7|nr:hypothetical protein [Enterococcus faecium]RBS64588.1 hypothetical protein EB40_00082 [Enterococcus faecium]RBT15428.1 hypothetical protein EA91_00273 [Enterococcus faecium]
MNQKINELLSTVLMEKNISFLIGAGASSPFFSSLGNLENVLTNENINEDGKRLIKALFYDASIANNIYLVEHLQDQVISNDENKESSPDSCVKCYTMFLPFLLIKIDVFS